MSRKYRRMSPSVTGILFLLATLGAFVGAGSHPPSQGQNPPAVDLSSLLGRAAEYCRKLESAALDFVCREEVTERINLALDGPAAYKAIKSWTVLDRERMLAPREPPKVKMSCIYDYQCVRSGDKIREKRTLLEENGKKKNEPNATLKTTVGTYRNALLGPVGLFSPRILNEYDYSIAGTDKFDRKPVVIVEAVPRIEALEAMNLYGKAWIDPATGDILKIEWNEKRVGNYEIFEARGKRYDRTPRITLRSEFSAEKNGIRFPTKLFIEEAYLNKRGRAFIRSETTIIYTDFKFFTVEVEIK